MRLLWDDEEQVDKFHKLLLEMIDFAIKNEITQYQLQSLINDFFVNKKGHN